MGIIYFVYAIPALSLLYFLSRYVRSQENLYAIMFYMAITGGEYELISSKRCNLTNLLIPFLVVLSQLLSMSYEKVQEYTNESRFLFILPDFGVRHAMSLAIFEYFTQLKGNSIGGKDKWI